MICKKSLVMNKLINWSELSRHITGGDRNCIRANHIPVKYKGKVNRLIKLIEAWQKWSEADPDKAAL